jgi:Xaa-Pro aminopeptidase
MIALAAWIAGLALPALVSQETQSVVLPLREQAALRDCWLEERLATVAPVLMREQGIDLWIVAGREYNEDPVLETMLPATWLAARRRTVLLLHDRGGDQPLECLAVARYDVGSAFKRAWDPDSQPDQWKRVAELVAERKPRRIGVNVSSTFALADGMTHSEHGALSAALPEELRSKLVSAEALCIRWLETRTAAELEVYPLLCRAAHEIIAQGLSEAAIQPGVTTTQDLVWWYRQAILARGFETWFHPDVELQRADAPQRDASFAARQDDLTIRPGDLLHVDFGITYLGLNTDTQQHAYVLRAGESDAPEGLQRGMATANRLQDLLMANFATGRTGNEVLAATREQARAEDIVPSIYSHPLGYHGHGAGAAIGMWDQQGGVPGTGDWPIHPSTCWSIELNATVPVPEWNGKEVRFMLEEDAGFDGRACTFLDGRQTELLLIPRPR